ncbi:MAG: hypothetical protein M3Q45_10465, partial [Chloroflexota bacterium]|nr:hypothetical protein [Chloroflexota bacterium]
MSNFVDSLRKRLWLLFFLPFVLLAQAGYTADATPQLTPEDETQKAQLYLPLIQTDNAAQASSLQQALPEDARRGLVYAGLAVDATGQCGKLWRVVGTGYCSHGPDPAPPGVDARQSQPPLATAALQESVTGIACDGNGTSGNRVQVMYVRAADRPDRYNQYLASIRQWAAEVDQIYYDSAAEVGGVRHVRYVHNASCVVSVLNIVIPPVSADNLG